MAKQKTHYVCSECGYETAGWMGKCPSCESWNTLNETVSPIKTAERSEKPATVSELIPLREINLEKYNRFLTGSSELDRVLGGGIVPASLVLCGGAPGIGKSTLLLQMADHIAGTQKVIYISAEESAQQIKLRADRLGVVSENLYIMAQTDLNDICARLEQQRPALVIVDSIQTVYIPDFTGVQGSVTQVRECAARLMRLAKTCGFSVFIVGHVTKEGAIAGPKVLEHIVDTVLYFEGDQNNNFRILRAAKNRYGSTNEIGIFEMRQSGMVEVLNPSDLLLSQSQYHDAGSTVVCAMEGMRPVLVDVQALVAPSPFGTPRRMGTGVDYNRLVMLLAVLEKKAGYSLYNQDVYLNIAGGLHIDETAADLAILAAVASSVRNVIIDPSTVLIGEVGLTGELRGVGHAERRVQESIKLGFKKMILPKSNRKQVKPSDGMEILFADTLKNALKLVLDNPS